MTDHYTRDEAQALLGKRYRATAGYNGVPPGTIGVAAEAYPAAVSGAEEPEGYCIEIEWRRPKDIASLQGQPGAPPKPLRDGFTRAELEHVFPKEHELAGQPMMELVEPPTECPECGNEDLEEATAANVGNDDLPPETWHHCDACDMLIPPEASVHMGVPREVWDDDVDDQVDEDLGVDLEFYAKRQQRRVEARVQQLEDAYDVDNLDGIHGAVDGAFVETEAWLQILGTHVGWGYQAAATASMLAVIRREILRVKAEQGRRAKEVGSRE